MTNAIIIKLSIPMDSNAQTKAMHRENDIISAIIYLSLTTICARLGVSFLIWSFLINLTVFAMLATKIVPLAAMNLIVGCME